MSRVTAVQESPNPSLSCGTNSDSASRPDNFSSTDRDSDVSGSVSSGNITKYKEIRPHTYTPDPFLHKHSSPVDPQVSKSDNETQEGSVNDTEKTPLSTPVDADNYLSKQDKEIDQTDFGFGEVETSATITANANKPESFTTVLPQQQENHSIEDTVGPYSSGALHNHTLTTKPPVLHEITQARDADVHPDQENTRDTVPSNVSIDEDEDHTAANVRQQDHWYQQTKGEEEQAVAVSPEIQDQVALQMRTLTPTQPTTDGLCTGMSQSRLVASPPHSSMATVLWVHPKSPLIDVYTKNGTAKLPTLGKKIGEELNEDIGYLLMEYFPLGAVGSRLHEFTKLESHEKDIEEIQDKMKESKTDSEFGSHRTTWQTLQAKRDKLTNCCYCLVFSVIESLKHFHKKNLVHLDIKAFNLLLRKTCEHKDKLICKCDSPPFNVLIGDFDYCHEVNTDVEKPSSKGTQGYQAISMRNNKGTQVAKPTHDLFGLLVTIIKVRSTMGYKQKCCEKMLKEWEKIVVTIDKLEAHLTQQTKVKPHSEKLESCEQPATEMDFNEDRQNCAGCKALRKGIEIATSQLKKINEEKITLTSFLQYAFSDINNSKLRDDLIGSLNDILNNYQTTVKKNPTIRENEV